MMWSLAAGSIALVLVGIFAARRTRAQDQLEKHSITAPELHALLASGQTVRLFDVRQPLDLLAHLEIIPGARRVPPSEVLDNSSVIPKNEAAVVYCTCPSDKTSREILRRALVMGFSQVKFLRGGLAAWKDSGYPVEPYQEVFHLNDAKAGKRSG